MAEATTYWVGLTRQANTLLQVNTDSATFPAYIGIVAAAEGLSSGYYYFSLQRDPRFNSIDYPTEFFVDIETDLGISRLVNGDVFIATPLQTGLTKEQKQIQKLEIAAKTRAADSNTRRVYDISELPTKYSGNDVYDNVNEGGLVQGRPWATDETPNSIAGLRFWIDTATTSTLNGGTYADGAALTAWTERKQNAAYTNPAANRRPTIQSGAGDLQNGYPVVRHAFPSAGEWDETQWTSVSGFANATGYTMVCVAKLTANALGSTNHILRIRNTSGTYSASVYYATGTGRFEMTAPTGYVSVDNTVDPDSTWKIITARYDSTQAVAANRFTFRWAKTARTITVQTTPSGALAADAGNNIHVGYFWDADFGEMMVYNTALTDAQIIALEDYLSSKWGV